MLTKLVYKDFLNLERTSADRRRIDFDATGLRRRRATRYAYYPLHIRY